MYVCMPVSKMPGRSEMHWNGGCRAVGDDGAGQHLERGLRHAVGGAAGDRGLRGARRDVDDPARQSLDRETRAGKVAAARAARRYWSRSRPRPRAASRRPTSPPAQATAALLISVTADGFCRRELARTPERRRPRSRADARDRRRRAGSARPRCRALAVRPMPIDVNPRASSVRRQRLAEPARDARDDCRVHADPSSRVDLAQRSQRRAVGGRGQRVMPPPSDSDDHDARRRSRARAARSSTGSSDTRPRSAPVAPFIAHWKALAP